MEMYGAKSQSLPQKSVILLSELGLIAISYFVLFGDWLVGIRAFGESPSSVRNGILFAFNLVVFARFLLTLFVFLKRRIPLEETFSVPMAFALYLLGFPLLARGSEVEIGVIEAIGMVLFCVGSFLNSYSELQRHRFKKRPDSAGKLYREGLFSISMHVNYFGDLLWVGGYTCVTRNIYAVAVPAFLFCFFYFFNIPKLDAYLRQRYGTQFVEYEKATKRLIPFLL